MKKIIVLLLCSTGVVTAYAADQSYTPPSLLTSNQAITAKAKMLKRTNDLKNHWQTRLVLAKQKKAMLRQSGSLNRPYYGDNGGAAH